MKKKVLMSIVLFIVVGTGAVFAQKAGETVQLGGQTYRVESSSNGRVVLQLVPTLDGSWRLQPDGNVFLSFSGSTAVFSDFAKNISPPNWQSAKDKGIIKVGDQYFRNLRSTGNLTWSGQVLEVTFNTSNPNVAIGTRWANLTITMSPDGNTFTSNGGNFIRAGIQ